MKRLLAILLAAIMILTLASCGGKDTEDEGKTDKPSTKDTTDAPADSGKGIKTALFSISYDEDVWNNVEDYLEDGEEYCFANLQIPDPEDPEYYLIDVEVEVSIDDPYDFREDLVYYGFDQYEYEENKAYDTVKVGGVDLLRYDNGEDTLVYFNRIEGAGASVYVEIDAPDIEDERIEKLIKGITFSIKDVGNEDGPWEWEGEKFTTEDHSATAGSFAITSKFVPFEAPLTTFDTFDHNIAAIGDKVYLLSEGKLLECHYDGSVLAFVKQLLLPEDDYEYISATNDGSLWVSGSMNDVIRIKDAVATHTYEDIDNLVMHPSGEWGIDYFVSNECEIVTFSGDTCSATPVVFKEADTISHISIDENSIYICASAADDSGHKVFVYNKEGVLQKTLCDAEGEGLGSVTFITQTANGYMGFDGNMRDVIFWDNDGAFIAEISDTDLFGTDYPWFCASTLMSDGSILTVMTEEREDRSATEIIVFNVKGF